MCGGKKLKLKIAPNIQDMTKEMNVDIKKDHRNMTNKFFHKAHGLNMIKTKSIAIKDITKECGEGKFYSRVYISIESKVLQWTPFDLTTRTLNLNQY